MIFQSMSKMPMRLGFRELYYPGRFSRFRRRHKVLSFASALRSQALGLTPRRTERATVLA